ncbi:hypothetical protein [Ancylobacter sp. IITR112]|uniref:hypothetical protein n=1 Tax=Ancylobacter sp. IITR112 TaxID=3138073 RepID=UPI00352BBC54
MSVMKQQDEKGPLATMQAVVAGDGQPLRSGRQPWKVPEVADVGVATLTSVVSNMGPDISELS